MPFGNLKALSETDKPAFMQLVQGHLHAAELDTLLLLQADRLFDIVTYEPDLNLIEVALIGDGNLNSYFRYLAYFLKLLGFRAQITCGAYGSYQLDLVDSKSFLYSKPWDLCVILIGSPSVPELSLNASKGDVDSQVRQALGALEAGLHGLKEVKSILVTNVAVPIFGDVGPSRAAFPASPQSITRHFNDRLGEVVSKRGEVVDIGHIACVTGLHSVYSLRGWFTSRELYSSSFTPHVARQIAKDFAFHTTSMRKVLILDLDNTLWGGVLGDDGIDGIELGHTSALGSAFVALQRQVLRLRERGVLLAVVSKNNESAVKQAIEEHPDMQIRLTDLCALSASWAPKSIGINNIAKTLGLGVEDFVFLDDNPVEIAEVQAGCPGITTIQASEDPSVTMDTLSRHEAFFVRVLTEEDLQKSQQYQAQFRRQESENSFASKEHFLSSLDMSAAIHSLKPEDTPRVAQLINKTNQFNLTTRRKIIGEVESFLNSPGKIGFSIRLADRFGDHGLVAVLLCEVSPDRNLAIETWVMSCRVLNRGLENLTCNLLVEFARGLNCTRITGEYIATKKNALVKDLYKDLGFRQTDSANVGDGCGETYSLKVCDFNFLSHQIKTEGLFYASRDHHKRLAAGI